MADDPEQPGPGAQSPPEDAELDIEVSIEDDIEATIDSDAPIERKHKPNLRPTARPIKAIYDDFSLTSGSASGVRFRNHTNTREFKIYDQPNAQLILEEVEDLDAEEGDGGDRKANRGIRIKQAYDTSYGLQFLRATYSLIAVFVGGFLLILGICILLFLFIDLAVQLGVTSNQDLNVSNFIAVGLSIPIFVYSLAMGMTLMTRFVVDTFYGHPFLRTFGLDIVTTDWIAFVMYLGIPLLTMIGTLYMQKLNWWEITCLTWFSTVLVFWGIFSACVLLYEVIECLDLIVEVEDDLAEDSHWLKKMKLAIVRGMRSRLCGTKLSYHRMTFSDDDDDDGIVERSEDVKHRFEEGPLTLLTKWKYLSCIYSPMDPPKRIYTLDETRGSVSFVTRTSWSLEKLFCRKGGMLGAVPITAGDYGITKNQINSTIVCRLMGLALYVLILGGFAHWFGLEGAELGLLLFVLFLFVILANLTTYQMLDVRRDVLDQRKVFRYWVKHQVTIPSVPFTLVFIILEIVIFFIIPLLYLGNEGNSATALVFAFFGLLSALRHYLNAQTLLAEIGPDHFNKQHRQSDTNEWRKKHRFYQIAEIGADSARWFWVYVFVGIIVFFVMVVMMATYDTVAGNVNDANYGFSQDRYTFMSDFGYDPQPYLPYPTCSLKKGITSTDFDASGLSSYSLLAGLAYTYENQTQTYLDEWYGAGAVTNDIATVNAFKKIQALTPEGMFSDSAVSYRFFNFGNQQGVVSIRGTSTIWDLMADAQLWLPATLFQTLRFFLPMGNVFTPILHHTTKFITSLESSSISKVAFYKETADFVEYLKVRGYNVIVTGHSLGGGLALITGSQTDTPAIGMSAPNSMISRDTFDPPVTVKDLNTLTFNVVPDKDIIPMVDDKARLYQNINCTAPSSEFVDCHSIVRTLCELVFSCGSNGRPVPCECVLDYGYPEPAFIGNGTATNFTQVCLEARGD